MPTDVDWYVSIVHGPIKVARVGPLRAKMNARQAVVDGLRPKEFSEGFVSCMALREIQRATSDCSSQNLRRMPNLFMLSVIIDGLRPVRVLDNRNRDMSCYGIS